MRERERAAVHLQPVRGQQNKNKKTKFQMVVCAEDQMVDPLGNLSRYFHPPLRIRVGTAPPQ